MKERLRDDFINPYPASEGTRYRLAAVLELDSSVEVFYVLLYNT